MERAAPARCSTIQKRWATSATSRPEPRPAPSFGVFACRRVRTFLRCPWSYTVIEHTLSPEPDDIHAYADVDREPKEHRYPRAGGVTVDVAISVIGGER